MEKNRIKGYGIYDEDPRTGRGYYTRNNSKGIPNAVPSIRMVRSEPLGDITNRIQSEYRPTINDYVRVKTKNNAELIRVIPKDPENDPNLIPAELDFGWTELSESTRNTNHSTLIHSAGHFLSYGKMLPDLLLKMVNLRSKMERYYEVFSRLTNHMA